jgi:multidrug efflux pump subunit AcrB
MNLKLPNFNFGIFVLDVETFIALVCFFIAVVLLCYLLVIYSSDPSTDEDSPNFSNRLSLRDRIEIKKAKNQGIEIKETIEKEAYETALSILDRARSDSLKILGQAQVKAQGLISNTYVISKESRAKLERSINEIYEKQGHVLGNLSDEILESYRLAIEEGKKDNIRTLYEVTEVMRQEAIQGVNELKDVVKKETIGAQDALEEKITTEYAKVDAEVREYKSKKVEGLNKKIFDLLSDVYMGLMEEDLDQIKHEKLILSLLDREIKKSGLNF